MYKHIIPVLILFFLNTNQAHNQTVDFYTAIICLGENNSGLNEYQFKNLDFYYTPKLKLTKDSLTNLFHFKGKPKILEEWCSKQDLQYHAVLFDENGTGAWEGYFEPGKHPGFSKGFNNMTFKEALDRYVVKKETVEETQREFVIYSSNSVYRGKYYQCPFVERKMVPFYIYDKTSDAILISELISRKNPILMVFCYWNDNLTHEDYQLLNSSYEIKDSESVELLKNLDAIIEDYVWYK